MAEPSPSRAGGDRLAASAGFDGSGAWRRFLAAGLDDFGTGYSSLGMLKALPVHQLKIDKSFVAHLHEDANDATIVRSVIDLGHTLGLEVVAEGVETLEAWGQLVTLGCDAAHGYHLAAPMPPESFLSWLAAHVAASEPRTDPAVAS